MICLDPLNFVRGGGSAAFLRGLEPRLFPYAQLSDGVLAPGEPDLSKLGRMSPDERCMPGDGIVPLRQILDALPPGLPLSVEIPMPKSVKLPAREWARATAEQHAPIPGGVLPRQAGGAVVVSARPAGPRAPVVLLTCLHLGLTRLTLSGVETPVNLAHLLLLRLPPRRGHGKR